MVRTGAGSTDHCEPDIGPLRRPIRWGKNEEFSCLPSVTRLFGQNTTRGRSCLTRWKQRCELSAQIRQLAWTGVERKAGEGRYLVLATSPAILQTAAEIRAIGRIPVLPALTTHWLQHASFCAATSILAMA